MNFIDMKSIIKLDNVQKTYPMGRSTVYALCDINLEVNEGDFLIIMGPSGSGKSTLMNILGLLDRPDHGSYLLNGQEVRDLTDNERSDVRNQLIGFIFQNFNLLPRANATRNVMLPLIYRKMPNVSRIEAAQEALESVKLSDRLDHIPSQLSGGERQRVAIARALVGKPSVILADEPTGNLDSATGQEIIEILAELSRQGQTVIMVTHDPRLINYADRVINMIDGRIVSEENGNNEH